MIYKGNIVVLFFNCKLSFPLVNLNIFPRKKNVTLNWWTKIELDNLLDFMDVGMTK